MTPNKRIFDTAVAIILTILLSPILLTIALLIRILDGAPIFYVATRMKAPHQRFGLVKFRTMKPVDEDSGVSGGDKSSRITTMGRVLRGARLDELPQLYNVLRGDISFVGPRPPLPQYVEKFPKLYAQVLKSRPGVTGLASTRYHRHEEKLLARCDTAAETDAIYSRACVPRKARIDLIYQRNRTLCFDMAIMVETVLPKRRSVR